MRQRDSSSAVARLKREVQRARKKKNDRESAIKARAISMRTEDRTEAILTSAMLNNVVLKANEFMDSDIDLFATGPETTESEKFFPDPQRPLASQKERNNNTFEYKSYNGGCNTKSCRKFCILPPQK